MLKTKLQHAALFLSDNINKHGTTDGHANDHPDQDWI